VAYRLAQSGAKVTVLEQHQVGGAASAAAAGMLAPLAEAEAPGPFVDLGVDSLARYPDFVAELQEATGLDVELSAHGLLHLAPTETEAEALRQRLAWQQEYGLTRRWLDRAELRALEPAVAPDLLGAVDSPAERHVQAPRLVQALAQAAARQGVSLVEGCPATGVETEGDRVLGVRTPSGTWSCGQLVLATGAWTGLVSEWFGRELPIGPVRGQVVAVAARPLPFRRIFYTPHGYLVPKADGRIIVGATEDHVGFDTRVSARGVQTLLSALPRLAPPLTEATFVTAWAGLRPASADGLPVLGPWPGWANVAVAAGHYRHGILLAPITADLVAHYLLTGRKEARLDPFGAERFFPLEP